MDPLNVLITGTSSGFGALIARTLVAEGHTVHATMRDVSGRNADAAAKLAAFAADQPGTLVPREMDVTDEASVNAACTDAGPLDVLVNNAGVGSGGLAEAFTPEQYATLFDINLLGVQRTMRAALPDMRERGRGLVINISSVMGRIVIPFSGPYTVSKWALEGLTEGYRCELLGTGIDVVSLEPGGFPTNVQAGMIGPLDEDRVTSYGARAGLPEKVWAPFMEMLAGPKAPDPQLVADEVARLVGLPAGRRPARVVVDPLTGGEGPEQINAVSDAVQTELNRMFGLES
jgi:NAD(P)-dependent dehydrogenase (short-subunit alcohol dehydrogenase family)